MLKKNIITYFFILSSLFFFSLQIYLQRYFGVVDYEHFLVFLSFGVKGFKTLKTKLDKGHKAQFREYVKRIQNGGEALIPLNEIINVTRTSFAAIESLKSKKWVKKHHNISSVSKSLYSYYEEKTWLK